MRCTEIGRDSSLAMKTNYSLYTWAGVHVIGWRYPAGWILTLVSTVGNCLIDCSSDGLRLTECAFDQNRHYDPKTGVGWFFSRRKFTICPTGETTIYFPDNSLSNRPSDPQILKTRQTPASVISKSFHLFIHSTKIPMGGVAPLHTPLWWSPCFWCIFSLNQPRQLCTKKESFILSW